MTGAEISILAGAVAVSGTLAEVVRRLADRVKPTAENGRRGNRIVCALGPDPAIAQAAMQRMATGLDAAGQALERVAKLQDRTVTLLDGVIERQREMKKQLAEVYWKTRTEDD